MRGGGQIQPSGPSLHLTLTTSYRRPSKASGPWRWLPGEPLVAVSWVLWCFQQLLLLRVLCLQLLLSSTRLSAEPGPLPFASLSGLLAEYTEQGKHALGGVFSSPPLPCLPHGNVSSWIQVPPLPVKNRAAEFCYIRASWAL